MENKNLKDKEVIIFLKNIKKNFDKDLDFFQNELEKRLMFELSLVLQEKSISYHELAIALNYILWAIDNRKWIPGNSSYLRWVTYFCKLYDKVEMKKYEEFIRKFTKRSGLSKERTDLMLLKTDKNILSDYAMEESRLESEEFAS
ncbi:hypothetical protein HYX16_01210 [Candidatus Woesearchaeota archaeon]|nr:hypothetical protein [Candidatus Woesearchaeota archaeon]